MILNQVSDCSVVNTGELIFGSGILGGVLITANGTNDATVTLQANNSDGFTVFKIVTKSPLFVAGPISILDGDGNTTQVGFYSVTGTGAGAQFYEWVQ